MSSLETPAGEDDGTSWLGRVLDARYRLNSVLGSGGFGHVFRAKHLILGRDVAVKLLHVPDASGGTVRARFEREATTLASVSHPNIVHVTDYGVCDGAAYLVMELVEGASLRDVIDAGNVTPERAIALVLQIVRGLGYAHEHGIVHRDLKPGNVIVQSLGAEEHVKLLDFGFAKFFTDAPRGMQNSLTEAGQAFGTPGYVAPEVLGQQSADGRTDLYAAGVILFELVAGRRPFQSDDRVAEMRSALTETPPPLAKVRPALAAEPLLPGIDAVVAKAMAKDPAARFVSAGEMGSTLAALIGVRESAPAIKPVPPPPVRNRAPLVWAAFSAVVALIAGAAVLYYFLTRAPSSAADAHDGTTDVADSVPAPQLADVLLGPPVGDRPAPVDPWAAPPPPELAAMRAKVAAGTPLSAADTRLLTQRTHDAPWDARSFLLLGVADRERGAPFAAVHAYQAAYRSNPACRGDVRMLHDLLVLSLDRRVGALAADTVVDIYGTEALPAVDRALAVATTEPEATQRFTALRARLAQGQR